MTADPSIDEILRALGESTEKLWRAVASGDAQLAKIVLEERKPVIQNLLRRSRGPLSASQVAELERIIGRGEEAVPALRARRETARALLGETEAVRRQLAGWKAKALDVVATVDLTG